MSYIKPENVTSPKSGWNLRRVVYDGGANQWSAAEGQWYNGTEWENVLAIRWNGNTEKIIGNPQSRGYPTWFIVPKSLEAAVREIIPSM